MKTAVLIPCYNEELTIEKVIKDFKKELPDADIYVYDNNCKDKTAEIASKNGAIVRHEYRQGKGNVVRSMFRDIDADIYVMVDGDDTYPAEEVHKLIKPVAEGRADMVIGDRLTNGTYQKENKRHFHEFGNNLVRKSINVLFHTKLKDIMTGYRVFNKEFVKNMGVEAEVSTAYLEGSKGALELAKLVKKTLDNTSSKFNYIYKDSDNIKEKIEKVSKEIYGATNVEYLNDVKEKIMNLEKMGYKELPICIAKTPASLSDNPKLLGRPTDFTIHVRDIKVSSGAGFIVVYTGDILTMPGLGKHSKYEKF